MLVEPLLEQVAYGAAVERAQLDSSMGRRLQAFVAIVASPREQPQAGAIAHLRMRFVGQLVFDDLPSVRADPPAPVEQALGCPVAMGLVRDRHVFTLGAVAAAPH